MEKAKGEIKLGAVSSGAGILFGAVCAALFVAGVSVISVATINPYLIGLAGAFPNFLVILMLYFQEQKKDRTNVRQLKELSALNAELDKSARLLVRRDLELSRANEQLRNLDKMKSEFISLVTHQLRTPLSGIKWSLAMLLNGDMGQLNPDQKLYLMKTNESNERMIALINDILQADRIEGKKLKLAFVPTQIGNLLDNVVTELGPLAEKKHVALRVDRKSEIPLIPIDPENVRVVLQNLIENAIKYTPKDGAIDISLALSGSQAIFTVKDSGIGIPQEQQKHIFKRFFRAQNAMKTDTDGSGLGLYIVESIVKKHQGSIKFESTEGKGTTFTVTLPVAEPERTIKKKN